MEEAVVVSRRERRLRWQGHVEEWRRSGLKVSAYCVANGLNVGQFWYWRRVPTDMRKSSDGLSGLVRNQFMRDPLTGDVFVFMNRRRDLLKALYWDRDGFALWCKRLERGRFVLPSGDTTDIDRAALTLLLEGVKARVLFRSPRYRAPKKQEETDV